MDLDKAIKELENGNHYKGPDHKETLWEATKWEIEWYFTDWRSSILGVVRGIKNFWEFRSEIYRYRWYDHSFLHDTLRSRLDHMARNWKDAHYVDSENEEKELFELVKLLDEIVELEDGCTLENDKKVDEKYQEFGRRLFDIKDYPHEDDKGVIHHRRFSSFRKFWD